MERAIQLIADLIEHFKMEKCEKETKCFYCGGTHKTAHCSSYKRKKFLRKFLEIEITSKKEKQIMNSSIDNFNYEEFILDFKKFEPKIKDTVLSRISIK